MDGWISGKFVMFCRWYIWPDLNSFPIIHYSFLDWIQEIEEKKTSHLTVKDVFKS